MNALEAALGPEVEMLAPAVREHFSSCKRPRHYRGTMSRVWRRRGGLARLAAPAFRLAGMAELLFPETGEDVPFELTQHDEPPDAGPAATQFLRTFHFPRRSRRFPARLTFDPATRRLCDRLGRGGRLEVEMLAVVRGGTLQITTGHQWLRLGRRVRVPVPSWLAGHASVTEWQEAEALRIRLVVRNPLLGELFGFEGTFREMPADETSSRLIEEAR